MPTSPGWTKQKISPRTWLLHTLWPSWFIHQTTVSARTSLEPWPVLGGLHSSINIHSISNTYTTTWPQQSSCYGKKWSWRMTLCVLRCIMRWRVSTWKPTEVPSSDLANFSPPPAWKKQHRSLGTKLYLPYLPAWVHLYKKSRSRRRSWSLPMRCSKL